MGLAAVKVKQKFGNDPRNTTWSNDTSRFGHQYLEKLGWQPGSGLGRVPHATTTHIKVSIKDDNVGLGAKLRRKEKKDEFDSGECAGLDAFQRLLGRLNGNESSISKEIERQKKDEIINGKWGINFVKGDVLASTWDTETKSLKNYSNEKKRVHQNDDEEQASKRIKKSKKTRKHKKKADNGDSTEEAKKRKKDKKESKERKDKKVKKSDTKKDKKRDKKSKASKGDIEDQSEKQKSKTKKDSKRIKEKANKTSRESMLKPKASESKEISSRLSVRSKWIKQKRAAVLDAKALNEIFMVTT
ncbi:LAFE_0E14818g1_1 [Lachancea fermentati]|uniref:Protein PXR1 n=1 Tax=Lachancea fermentati TaxID=4955 RepID=A0A1G4MEG1_LACFM|nr:LAFE_0E14818g1_1 [Lachancea fermentati]